MFGKSKKKHFFLNRSKKRNKTKYNRNKKKHGGVGKNITISFKPDFKEILVI
jgi:hypothetical protein